MFENNRRALIALGIVALLAVAIFAGWSRAEGAAEEDGPQNAYVVALWEIPMTPAEYEAAGSPTGPGDNGIWPQTLVDYIETAADVNAAHSLNPGTCGKVYQGDRYPRAEGLEAVADGVLEDGEDSAYVIDWVIIINRACDDPEATPTPEVTPTASPTPGPTESPTPEPTETPEMTPTASPTPAPEEPEEPRGTPTPTASPTPAATSTPDPTGTPVLIPAASSESRCVGNDLHTVYYEDGIAVSTTVAVYHSGCYVAPVGTPVGTPVATPPAVGTTTPVAPTPADTGHGGAADGSPMGCPVALLALGTIGGMAAMRARVVRR